MKVDYLFSRNKKLGSRIISWASGLLIKDLEKIPSHVAVLLDDHFVMESTLIGGVKCVPLSYWSTQHEECYRIPCEKIYRSKKEIVETFESVYGKAYDYPAILFFAWCFIKHILFKSKFPSKNSWQSDDKFMCTEFAGRLSGYQKHSMTTPAKMCSDFLKE